MRHAGSLLMVLLVLTSVVGAAPLTQDPTLPPPLTTSSSAPIILRVEGRLLGATGEARSGRVVLVASLYALETDSTPLWTEQQIVSLSEGGRYVLVVGASMPDGIPKEYLLTGEGRWMGISVPGEAEQPRFMLTTVPYALKAREADTLSGRAATDFVLAENLAEKVRAAFLSQQGSVAQSLVVGSGTGIEGPMTNVAIANALVKYTSAGGAMDSSTLWEVGGRLGVGTGTPATHLHVAQGNAAGGLTISANAMFAIPTISIMRDDDTSGTGIVQFIGSNSSVAWALGANKNVGGAFEIMRGGVGAGTTKLLIDTYGRVGIGTTAPTTHLHVSQGNASGGLTVSANALFAIPTISLRREDAATGTGIIQFLGNDSSVAWAIGANKNVGGAIELMRGGVGPGTTAVLIDSAGNLGIGTSAPTAKLHVAGNGYFTGSVVVDGNIGAKYQDVAEWVETVKTLEAGTVVIVDPLANDHVMPSARAYDTRVAGAVSRQPGLVLGEPGDTKSLVAQSGRVRIKVDATYGAIKPGDLLVTSPTAGHAMLSKPMKIGGQFLHRPGTLVGKALEGLAAGKGEILVLLTLQ